MSIEENDIPENINRQINETLGITETQSEEYTPIYKMYGDTRIPVSSAEGKLWKTRKDQALKVMKDVTEQWDLTYKYFNSDHINIRDDGSVEFKTNSKLKNNKYNSENLVWANNIGMVPVLYSQDPTIEVTSNKDKDEENVKKCTMIERLLNVLMKKRTNPGLNIKTKVRKGILNTLLTNRGVIKIGWTFKIDSNGEALNEITEIGKKLQETKDVKTIKELEGKLIALEEVVNFASPAGPTIKHIRPYDLIIDPNALDQDGTDANWIMEREWIPTEYLKAKFSKETEDNFESLYKPGKVLALTDSDSDNDEDDLLLSDSDNTYESFGYENSDNYKKSCLTECYWIWDKIKHRVYLYSGCNWEYPIWVWEDPYQLEEFYPYYILNFHENPNETLCKGETSYYLDQQNTINMINAQLQKMREFGFNHYLFDSNSGISSDDIQKWVDGKRDIVGVKLPPNKTFEQILYTGQLPSDKNQVLYDKGDLLRVVDMISGTDATTRNGEFKTNTTNLAIQNYMAGKSIKLEDKKDLIETWIGNIGWGIAQLCLMYMDKEQVESLLGFGNADLWENLAPNEIRQNFSVQCVGGSTVKPTSEVKKQQALQISQVLGQFASASPYVVIIMLQILQRALDDVVVKEEDIETIKMSILQQIQAQQMQAQQEAQLAQAEVNQANTNAGKNVAETQQIQQQPVGF